MNHWQLIYRKRHSHFRTYLYRPFLDARLFTTRFLFTPSNATFWCTWMSLIFPTWFSARLFHNYVYIYMYICQSVLNKFLILHSKVLKRLSQCIRGMNIDVKVCMDIYTYLFQLETIIILLKFNKKLILILNLVYRLGSWLNFFALSIVLFIS